MKNLFQVWFGTPLQKTFGVVALLCVFTGPILVLESGCNKGTLAPGGSYSPYITNADGSVTNIPQNALYTTDQGISTAKNLIDAFLKWELANRALVQTQYPEVTQYAIKLSNDAPKWLQSAVRLRDAWQANPTAAHRSAFDQSMAVLDQAVIEAQQYLAKAATPTK